MTRDEYTELVDFLGRKFDRIDERFEQVDQRFERLEGEVAGVKGEVADVKGEVAGMKWGFDAIHARVDRVESDLSELRAAARR